MNNNQKNLRAGSALSALILASVGVVAAVPVQAQETTPSTSTQQAQPATQDIVVTGSRIANPNLTSVVPVTSVRGEEFFQSGQVSIGDQLNQLPQLASTFSQSNSTRFLGTAGLNLLDLRQLGTSRTLVLVNGRRHVASDILNSGVSVDTNTIPTDLIDRVDIVTGGSSAVYGSDAIAGVVNFVLKDHFEGLQARAQSGVSTYGDAASQFVSVLAGKNFSEGRGNVAVNAEFAHQDQYFGSGRKYVADNAAFIQVLQPGSGTASTPERILYHDVRNAGYTNAGVVRFGGTNSPLNCGVGPNGVGYNCPYTFTTGGNLVPLTGQRVGFGPTGSFIGGNGNTFREDTQFQLQPRLDRVNLNLVAHYSFSDLFEPFVEATWSHTVVYGSGSGGPAFVSGTTLGGDPRERVRLDNPYLTDQARSLITAQLIASGSDPSKITGATRFSVREVMTGLGYRAEQSTRDTYRAVAGVRGAFNDTFRYELSANYGEFQEKTRILGNLNQQRFLLANDAARNGAGQIVCRSQIDPSAAIPAVDNDAILARDVAACVPINLMGGQFTNAQRAYLLQDTTSIGKITQFDVNGFVSGDLHNLFSLPGGPIAFSIGGEYRRETNYYKQDPLVEQGYTFYNAIPTFTAPAMTVKEAFGEIRVPLLKDLPLLRDLTLSAAGRVSDYNTKTGTVWSYNFGGEWSPIRDIRFRANYARAVRAPNLGELYTPPGQNFAPGFADPCARDNITGGPNPATRAKNCAAAGIPTSYNYNYSQSLEVKSGGNPNLTAEKSDSYTFGVAIQPHWVPGLSLTVDYYNIKVREAISSIDAQTIANFCYDLASGNGAYCSLFQRAGSGGAASGEEPYRIIEGSLIASSANFGLLRARGIDVDLAYQHQISDVGLVNFRVNYSHVIQRDDYVDPNNPSYITRYRGNLGTPIDRFVLNTDVKSGKVTAGYRLRWIGHQNVGDFTAYNPLNGNPPSAPYYANYRYYPVVAYHDIRVDFDVSPRFNIYAGMDNVGDKHPPLDTTGLGGGSGIYDVRGRYMYTGIAAKF
ncbi:TonB-dependent receptor domain-containing protein [Sphingomonas azotifigens]|uniref:TonB-dependent receptor domain-containing protein n=1 Tax=Sphingomonas azotifigens TaxID=330920 RepID=UPI0009FDC4E5|nr:TonB-dependent receptor [Sphingomonas azotifigens]